MTTTAGATPAASSSVSAQKEQFLTQFEREHETTMRVLRAYPPNKLDLRPAPKCKTARELAWIFAMEQEMTHRALTRGLNPSDPASRTEPPATLEEIVSGAEEAYRRVLELVRGMPDAELAGTTRFFVAPRTMGDIPKLRFLWLLLHDQIHHRGQFSIYLRMADGRLPSIYGPTADEPWN